MVAARMKKKRDLDLDAAVFIYNKIQIIQTLKLISR